MNTVEIGQTKREFPSKWNELTYNQLIYIAGLFSKGLSIVDFKSKVLIYFLHIKKKILRMINNEDVYFLTETLNFLLNDVDLTKNVIKRIRTGNRIIGRWLYGPDDLMGYCTFGEFVKANVRYDAYIASKDDKYLDEMTAILYRHKKILWILRKYFTESIDPRVKFIDRKLTRRTDKIARKDHALKYAVFLFFSGVLGSLPKKFPNIYRQKKEDYGDDSQGWAGLVISLADGKTDDESLDKVMNSNLYNVLMGLEQKSIEYFRFIEETEKNAKK